MYGEFGKNKSQLKRSNEKVKMLFDLCADKFQKMLSAQGIAARNKFQFKKRNIVFPVR